MFLTKLKNIAVNLEKKNNSIFSYPVEKQKEYLNKFKEPKDDIERSFFQYKCQMQLNKPIIRLFLNVASLPMLILYYTKKCDEIKEKEKVEAVFFADGKPENIIPSTLRKQYLDWKTIDEKGEYWSKFDKEYFSILRHRYPFSWHYLLKCLIKIRFYSYELKKRNPKAIVVCDEYSFTSSMLTNYCEIRSVKHIDVMHGEKLYYMRDSFFHFNTCYVWDENYAKLFRSLRAEESQFSIEIPESLQFVKINCSKTIDFTYYLGTEEGETLELIVKNLNILNDRGFKVSIRPHPRYSDIKKIRNLCSDKIEIEDGKQFTIEESVLRTKYAISRYSTVLNQAFHNGTGIIIDDVADSDSFKKLAELKYVMLAIEHKLLSEVLEEANENHN